MIIFLCKLGFCVTLMSETVFGNWKLFKNDEKCFLFHLKNSISSQDISIFIWLFGHVAKRFDWKDNFNFKFYDVIAWLAREVKAIRKRNFQSFFLEKSYIECGGGTSPTPFSEKLKLGMSLDQ